MWVKDYLQGPLNSKDLDFHQMLEQVAQGGTNLLLQAWAI